MISLGFDTETTGLVERRNPIGHHSQPDVLQLCAKLFDDQNDRIYSTIDILVIPEKEISKYAEEVNGYTLPLMLKYGVSRRAMVGMFMNMLKKADQIVCHNTAFDVAVMLTACARENIDPALIHSKPKYCTMIKSTPILKLPSKFAGGDFKWPSLAEAYAALVDPKGFENAHNAQADVDAMICIYRALKKLDAEDQSQAERKSA